MKEHTTQGDVYILAIESSCDETAASVVKNGREVCSNVISSQIALHTQYGGVVPEIASRKHIEKINQVIEAALSEADMALDDMTAIAVTYGPGLVGPLLVGVAEAKALAYAAGKPLIGVTPRTICPASGFTKVPVWDMVSLMGRASQTPSNMSTMGQRFLSLSRMAFIQTASPPRQPGF